MQTRIDIHCSKDSDSKFAARIRLWAEELIDSLTGEALPQRVSIRLYHLIDELQKFFQLWENNYGWIGEAQRRQMLRFAAETAICSEQPFQHWLELTALNLIADPRL